MRLCCLSMEVKPNREMPSDYYWDEVSNLLIHYYYFGNSLFHLLPLERRESIGLQPESSLMHRQYHLTNPLMKKKQRRQMMNSFIFLSIVRHFSSDHFCVPPPPNQKKGCYCFFARSLKQYLLLMELSNQQNLQVTHLQVVIVRQFRWSDS